MSFVRHLPPYAYCPICAQPLEQSLIYKQKCTACDFILYHGSSPCMSAIPVDAAGRVLLARRGIEPYFGAWNMVGGFLDYGEEPVAGLIREVQEETGADCRVLDFIIQTADIYGEGGEALLNTYYTVELLSDRLTPQDDVSELVWFDLDNLPDDIPFASDRRALEALKRKIAG